MPDSTAPDSTAAPAVRAYLDHKKAAAALAPAAVAAVAQTVQALFPQAAYLRLSRNAVDEISIGAVLAPDGATIAGAPEPDGSNWPAVPGCALHLWGGVEADTDALERVLTDAHQDGVSFLRLEFLPALAALEDPLASFGDAFLVLPGAAG
ncbi:hypothetical protein [Kitasatospora sp. NPDC088783]|uniref:hypothetical protein n=1 Tax=Kitasatospora sp. NPDC088783 TaxID=3364077 RepID=UPI0037FD8463